MPSFAFLCQSNFAYSLATKHQDRRSAHFRARQSLNPYVSHYRKPFVFSTISSTQSHRLSHGLLSSPLKALDIAMFYINIFSSDLGVFCIPIRRYLRTAHVIEAVLQAKAKNGSQGIRSNSETHSLLNDRFRKTNTVLSEWQIWAKFSPVL